MKSKLSLLVLAVVMASPVFADDDIWGAQDDHAAESDAKKDVRKGEEDIVTDDQSTSVNEEDDVD